MPTRRRQPQSISRKSKSTSKGPSNRLGLLLTVGFGLICVCWFFWKKTTGHETASNRVTSPAKVEKTLLDVKDAADAEDLSSKATQQDWPIPGDWSDEARLYLTPSLPQGAELIRHTAYQLAYNEAAEQPYWVSYMATKELVSGDAVRRNNFFEDMSVSTGSATTKDYTRSGWSRGHMAPCDDFKATQEICDETFAMSNMCPQNQALNGGRWNTLETFVNRRAFRGRSSLVICGPIFRKSPTEIEKIGRSEVWVPDAFYKIVYTCDKGHDKMIGFVMDNKPQPKGALSQWVVSINQIEKETELDFFAPMEDEKEEMLETKIETTGWSLP